VLHSLPKLGLTNERKGAVAAILTGGEIPARAAKTRAFHQNILGNYREVTIDGWMLKGLGLKSVTERQYFLVSSALRSVATANGDDPATLQAILWGYYRQGSGWAKHDTEHDERIAA
jgi:hypothetical protein